MSTAQGTSGPDIFVPTSARERAYDPEKRVPEKYWKDELFELEEKGELIVHRISRETDKILKVRNKWGGTKLIPGDKIWHHKSCGQCGHIPGYPVSIQWIMKEFGVDSFDPFNQSSCTAWNYYASATSNPVAQAAVACRNFAQAYEDRYWPMIHCGTSFGHYKETREEIIHHPELRDGLRKVMDKLKMPVVFPEEVVHYSEWVYAVRDEIKKRQVHDVSAITATVHPACHYHKLVPEDAVYDEEILNGQRTAAITGIAQKLGANIGDYSTWHDCCGFGFRHILVSRDFTRSFATIRKIERMKEEVNPDVVLAQDTGCLTTLDKSQFAAKGHGRNVGVPVMADVQFAALAMGAHPYKVVQLHWHGQDPSNVLTKMGIDPKQAWAEFQESADKIKSGEQEFLQWEDC